MLFNSFSLYFLVGLSIFLESFPISSSGHIFLLQQLFEHFGISFYFDENIEYVLHGPTALVVALFFYNRWKLLLIGLPRSLTILQKIVVFGFITDGITVAAYFLFFNYRSDFPLWIGFLITGFCLLSLFFCKKNVQLNSWNYKNSFILGATQAFALLPGISRFGSTFVIGRWLGFSSRKSFELSFLLEWPISVAATIKGFHSLYNRHEFIELLHPTMILVIIIATLGALIGLWIMQQIIRYDMVWLISLYLFLIALFTAFF